MTGTTTQNGPHSSKAGDSNNSPDCRIRRAVLVDETRHEKWITLVFELLVEIPSLLREDLTKVTLSRALEDRQVYQRSNEVTRPERWRRRSGQIAEIAFDEKTLQHSPNNPGRKQCKDGLRNEGSH